MLTMRNRTGKAERTDPVNNLGSGAPGTGHRSKTWQPFGLEPSLIPSFIDRLGELVGDH